MESLIYILIGIILFLYQVFKESGKMKKEARKKRPDFEPLHTPSTKEREDKYFDDLQKKKEDLSRKFEKKRKEVLEPVSFEDLIEEIKGPKRTQKKMVSRQETAPEKPIYKKRITETPDLEKILPGKDYSSGSRAKIYQLQSDTSNPYASLFKNPESIKQAFIASEIFKRKEF